MTALPNAFTSWLKLGFVLLLATGSALTILRYSAPPKAATSAGAQQPAAANAVAHAPAPSSAPPSSQLDAVHPEPPNAAIRSSADASKGSVPTTSNRNPLTSSPRTTHPRLAARDAANRHIGKTQNAIPAGPHAPNSVVLGEDAELENSDNSSARAAERREPQVVSSALDDHFQAHTGNAPNATQKRLPADETSSQNDATKSTREQAAPPLSAAAERRASAGATNGTLAESTPTRATSAELIFLKRIQAALHANELQEVLELVQEHERRWPEGMFAQEREGLRAIAACRAHVANAASAANKFFATYPRSPMFSRVRAACTPPSAANGPR